MHFVNDQLAALTSCDAKNHFWQFNWRGRPTCLFESYTSRTSIPSTTQKKGTRQHKTY